MSNVKKLLDIIQQDTTLQERLKKAAGELERYKNCLKDIATEQGVKVTPEEVMQHFRKNIEIKDLDQISGGADVSSCYGH